MGDLAGSVLDGVMSWLATQLGHVLDWLWALLSSVLFVSPDVSGLPQIQHASGLARGVVNAALALLVTVIGLLHIVSGDGQRSQYSFRVLGPRLVISVVAANFASVVVSIAIAGTNAVTSALTGVEFSTGQAVEQIRTHLASIGSHPANALLVLILQNCLTFALAALLISWLVRIGQLLLVAAVAPIALACHVSPATQVVADAWWRTLATALLTQMLQAVALTVAATTMASPDASLPVLLGLPQDPGGVTNLAVAAFLTAQVALIPRYLLRMLRSGTGRAPLMSTLFRMLVVQQVLGAVGLRGSRGRPGTGRLSGRAVTVRDSVHYHAEGERQTTNLYGENAVQHTHTHERGSHEYQQHHVHHTVPPRPKMVWRPSRAGAPASIRLRRNP